MPEETTATDLLDGARAFLGLTLEEARNVLGADARSVPGDEYGRLRNVTSLESEDQFPGTLYVEADEVRFVRVGPEGLQGLTGTALCSLIADDPVRLRSRSGKRAQLLVYPGAGIAFSTQGEEIDFLEVFGPCTRREYETRYYEPPAPFIR
jgi:hypothetical protein